MDFIGLIVAHGYWIVLAVAFVDQFGTPVPAIAILLTSGAVAGQGHLSFAGVLAAAWAGTVAGDAVLYQCGRWRGGPLMRRLCSFSLAPDTCVRKTETSFQRLGWKALVVAKFVPVWPSLPRRWQAPSGCRSRRSSSSTVSAVFSITWS